jgi:hypothetical protein
MFAHLSGLKTRRSFFVFFVSFVVQALGTRYRMTGSRSALARSVVSRISRIT